MKNDTTLCACAVVITLDTQNVEKGHLAPPNLTFLLIAIDRNGFRRVKEEGQICKRLPQIFQFLPRDFIVTVHSEIFFPNFV